MAFLGDLLIRLRAETGDFQSDMGKAAHVAEKTSKRITSVLGKLGIAFGAVQTARFAQGIITAQDELGKLSQKTNMSVKEAAGWVHALDLANVSQEALQKTAKALGTQMLDASMGLAEAKRNFAALDIGIKNSDGSLKSVNAVLLEVADRFANATDKTAAAALMNKLLGKSALDLIPAFKDGRAALEAMIAEGQRLNPITEESSRQAEQFNDNITRLSKSIKSEFIVAMNAALPAMAGISEKLVEATREGKTFWGVMNEGAKLYLATMGTLFPFLESITQKAFNALAAKDGTILRPGEVAGKIGGLPKIKPPFVPKITDETAAAAAKKAAQAAAKEYDWLVARLQEGDDEWQRTNTEAWQAYEETAKQATETAAADRATMLQQVFAEIDAEQERAIQAGADYLAGIEDAAKKAAEIGKELGFTFSSAFEDAILKGAEFRDVLKGIASDILRIIARKAVTEPIAASISNMFSGFNFGSFFGGSSPVAAFAAGTDYVPRDGFAYLHKGEAVTPASETGRGITFSPIINIDSRTDSATIARTVDGAMRMSEARLIEQLNRGQGGITQAVRRA